MSFEEHVAILAAKYNLGQTSAHIFNIWELPLQPFTTSQLVRFAAEVRDNAYADGYADGLLHGVRGEEEK